MIPIKPILLTNHNRPGKKIIKLKGIVMHWTGNKGKGATAIANRNYFNSTKTAASAHYIVDDKTIVQCIPDDEIAYHVGAKRYTSFGDSIRQKPYTPNFHLIGIEMCVNIDGNWNKTYKNSVDLAAYILNKHNFGIENLYRHYDITGKTCPAMMIDDGKWHEFRVTVSKRLKELKYPEKSLNPIMQCEVVLTAGCYPVPNAQGSSNGKISKGTKLNIYKQIGDWYLINPVNPQWIKKSFVKIIK